MSLKNCTFVISVILKKYKLLIVRVIQRTKRL